MTLKGPTRTILLPGVACVTLAIGGFSVSSLRTSDPLSKYDLATVKQGDFVRTVPAVGEVSTFKPAVVYSDCRAWEKPEIIKLVPQGTFVEEGDIVCVLDAKEFLDKLPRPVLAVIADDARILKSAAEEDLQKHRNSRRMAVNKLAAQVARGNLHKYREGDSHSETRRLSGVSRMKAQQFEKKTSEYRATEKQARAGVLSWSNVVEADRAKQLAQQELRLARGKEALLENFGYPRTMIELEGLAEGQQDEVEFTELRNSLELSMVEFQTLSFRKYRAGWQQYVDYLTDCINACEMRAPKAGQVVYATSEDSDRRIELGKRVHYKQHVFSITDRDKLTINGRVSDRHFYGLRKGQKAVVQFSSLPGERFSGTLTWFGPIPAAMSKFTPHILHHKVQILLDDPPETLKAVFPGMTAEVDLIVESRYDVTQVETGAIVRHDGDLVSLVATPRGLERRVIEIGVGSDLDTQVTEGLTPGEQVVVDHPEALRALAETLVPSE